MIGGDRREIYIAVNTLGYSRRFHVWASYIQDTQHTYESLAQDFTHFGGVTTEVMVGNQKSTVLTPAPVVKSPATQTLPYWRSTSLFFPAPANQRQG
jgi:transposase